MTTAPGAHVIVIGAGMGGLAAALDLASSDVRVTVLERHAAPGGKMREVEAGGRYIDSGPTVFTMRWVFEDLFRDAGLSFAEHVNLLQHDRLARHFWLDGSELDLFADVDRSVDAIAAFAGKTDADAYRRFAADSKEIFETLDHSFMRRERPGPVGLTLSMGLDGISKLKATKPFVSLWKELKDRFNDPRLRQLFGRYATYTGSSPLDAPATLMLIAHAERAGVWIVDGGMQRLAEALARAAGDAGAEFRYESDVAVIATAGGCVNGVVLEDGTSIPADAVVFNGDVKALTTGLLGGAVTGAAASRRRAQRSLSAVTWSIGDAVTDFPLDYHTVFFGSNYTDEFRQIFDHGTITAEPTVYVCAQDRGPGGKPGDNERLFMLVNAPPRTFDDAELDRLEHRTFDQLKSYGCTFASQHAVRTSPNDFGVRFPGTDGAIYGWPTHGWSGSFRRHGSRARVQGLYLAGGTVHPGPGIPMAAQSGRLAAISVRKALGH